MMNQQRVATKCHQRGWKHYACQEFDDCLVDWRRALMIRDTYLGSRHASTKESIDLIRTVLLRMGLTDADCRRYIKVLKKSIRHEAQGDAYAVKGLGSKSNKKALREYCKALKLEESLVGNDHHMITATLHRKMASVTADSTPSSSWPSNPDTSPSFSSKFFPSLRMSASSSTSSTSSLETSDTSVLLFCDTLASHRGYR